MEDTYGPSAAEQVDESWLIDTFIPTVAKRGAPVTDARRASSAGSAANAALDHVYDWVNGTDWASSSAVPDGSYEVPEGLISSFPCRAVGGEWQTIPGVEVNELSRSRIDAWPVP